MICRYCDGVDDAPRLPHYAAIENYADGVVFWGRGHSEIEAMREGKKHAIDWGFDPAVKGGIGLKVVKCSAYAYIGVEIEGGACGPWFMRGDTLCQRREWVA